jgi:hypothetical protein
MRLAPRHLCTVLLFALTTFTAITPAGTLDDFEQDATKHRSTSDDKYDDPMDSCVSDFFDSCLTDIISDIFETSGKGLYYGGLTSSERANGLTADSFMPDLVPREPGEALIPFFRFDTSYQYVDSNVDAYDYRLELGSGPWAVQARQTHYTETNPRDTLDLIQAHGLYRMSYGNILEMDFGLGIFTMNGNATHSGFSYTGPLLLHPNEYFGVELRPSWSIIAGNSIRDCDLSVLFSLKQAGLRVGYRWVQSYNESLHGPHCGLTVKF